MVGYLSLSKQNLEPHLDLFNLSDTHTKKMLSAVSHSPHPHTGLLLTSLSLLSVENLNGQTLPGIVQ